MALRLGLRGRAAKAFVLSSSVVPECHFQEAKRSNPHPFRRATQVAPSMLYRVFPL
jgi:hypothetical protein